MRCHCTDSRWPTASKTQRTQRPGMLQSTRAFFFVPTGEQQRRQRGSMKDSRTREWSAQLEGQPAADILAWAAHQFAPRVAFGTGFGAEGCVIIHLIAEHELPI